MYNIHKCKLYNIIGTLVFMAALVLPGAAAAWMSIGDGEPSKYSRHVSCNNMWRASHAHNHQQCKLRSVHWDSYHDKPGFFGDFYRGSTCWVHVECKYGDGVFPTGVHLGKIKMYDVPKLRRCKHDASLVNTFCDPITKEYIDQGVANHNEQMAGWMSAFAKWLEENGHLHDF